MLKLSTLKELALFLVKSNDLDLISGILNERAHRESDVPLSLVTEVDRVYRPLPFVGINLLPFWLLVS
jgi:hypothetical protein